MQTLSRKMSGGWLKVLACVVCVLGVVFDECVTRSGSYLDLQQLASSHSFRISTTFANF